MKFSTSPDWETSSEENRKHRLYKESPLNCERGAPYHRQHRLYRLVGVINFSFINAVFVTFVVSEVSSFFPWSDLAHSCRILNRLIPSQGYISPYPFSRKSVEARVNNVPTINNREINTKELGIKMYRACLPPPSRFHAFIRIHRAFRD